MSDEQEQTQVDGAMTAKANRTTVPMWDRSRPPTVAGYQIVRVLGQGGMGVVYEAKHLALKRSVALKTIGHPAGVTVDDVMRFRLKAELIASLKHPNIVQIYEIGDSEGRPYFALELVEGGTLHRTVKKGGVTLRDAASMVVTIARAVHAAHQRGIIHRDLKPANILLTADGVPKVADFGIARSATSGSKEDHQFMLGTPGYMAPESISTPWAATHLVDVFALGAILHALLTGTAPYRGASSEEVLVKTVTTSPTPPSRGRLGSLEPVPRDLDIICLKALAKSPAERYPSAAALADDLDRWLAGEPIRARQHGTAERVLRWYKANPVPTALMVATVVGAFSSVWYMSRLANSLAETTALQGAAQEVETLEKVTDYYTDNVVGRVNPHDVPTSTHYRDVPGTIPVPATLTIELGDIVTGQSQMGQQVRMYSDLPFQNRKDGGARNEFERNALAALHAHPEKPFYSFEKEGNRMVLRYAKARVLKKACVDCHNSHPESPRTDWKEGEVRGALEVVRYLDADVQRSRAGLRGVSVLMASALLLLTLLTGRTAILGALGRKKA
jgi:hypothetical protein